MKRAEILEAARVCVCGEREQDYGTPEETVFVMEDWEPTEHFLQCRREARHE